METELTQYNPQTTADQRRRRINLALKEIRKRISRNGNHSHKHGPPKPSSMCTFLSRRSQDAMAALACHDAESARACLEDVASGALELIVRL